MRKEFEKKTDSKRPRYGRPSRVSQEARSCRVVTFLTDWQVEGLDLLAQKEGRTRSDVVHRIISEFLKKRRPLG